MLITTEGLTHLNDVSVHGTTPVSPWYVGLISSTGWSALAAADTLASHAGWTEEIPTTAALRLAWVEGAAAAGVTTSSATTDFAIISSATIKGYFLASAASGTSGTLLGAMLFSEGDRAVVSGDTLQVTVTLTATTTA